MGGAGGVKIMACGKLCLITLSTSFFQEAFYRVLPILSARRSSTAARGPCIAVRIRRLYPPRRRLLMLNTLGEVDNSPLQALETTSSLQPVSVRYGTVSVGVSDAERRTQPRLVSLAVL